MAATQHFTFKFNNVKFLWYLLFCFAGIPLALIFATNAPFIIFFLIIFAPLVLSLVLVIKKMRIKEDIQLGNNFLESAYYGKIHFKEIHQIATSNMWGKPNLIVKLKDGRKLRWVTISNINTNENYLGLKAFIDGFTEAILTAGSNHSVVPNASKVQHSSTAADFGLHEMSTPVRDPGENMDPDTFKELKEDIQSVKSRNSAAAAKIAIPVSLGIALLGFIRYYVGPKIQESKHDRVAEMFRQGMEENRDLKTKAMDFIQQYQHQKGPFYLLSNDTAAALHYLPDIKSPDGYEGPLSYVYESDSLRKLLASPDSMSWNIYVKTGNNKVYGLQKNIMNTNDSTDTYVYFTEIVPDIKTAPPASLFNASAARSDEPDSIPTQLTFVVPLYPDHSIRQNLEDGMLGYKMFLSLLTHHAQTTEFYMAGRQGEGRMDQTLFQKVAATIKSDLNKQGADTSRLVLQQID